MLSATPSVKRRFTVMIYESMLVFGVLFCAVALFLIIAPNRRDPLKIESALQFWGFIVLGAYFMYSWCKGGQTLAMQTWRIKLTSADGGRVTPYRALARYLLAWLWFMPGWTVAHFLGLTRWPMMGLIAVNISVWALLAYLDKKDRQFLHDRLAGTRLISVKDSQAVAT